MRKMKFKTEQELLNYTKNIIGKTFRNIDSKGLLEVANLNQQKNLLYSVVETGFYKFSKNSTGTLNFEELGIRLIVLGHVTTPDGTRRAKERVILHKINFNEIINETFETSNVLGNCKKMLIIWYQFIQEKEPKDFIITNYQLYDLNNDKKIFENDFEIIKNKVLEGKAHELSEGDTSYLGVCTSAKNSYDRTSQPFSDILLKPRAYSLKNAYMSGILRESKNTKLITVKNTTNTVEEYITNKLMPYFGKTQIEILEEISGKKYYEKIPKNISKMISDKLIGKDQELAEKDDLFKKTNFIIKNLPIQENGIPRERMSFRTIKLSDFKEEWENSFWKNYFEETTLITICYQEKNKSRNGYRILKDVKKITFDETDLTSFEKTYNQIRLAIKNEDISLLPTSTNGFKNQLLEIAPKGVKGDNAYVNFFNKDKTKVAFMISKKLLIKKLNPRSFINDFQQFL